jgi:hypothetical protein
VSEWMLSTFSSPWACSPGLQSDRVVLRVSTIVFGRVAKLQESRLRALVWLFRSTPFLRRQIVSGRSVFCLFSWYLFPLDLIAAVTAMCV